MQRRGVAVLVAALMVSTPSRAADVAAAAVADAIDEYCITCHNVVDSAGGLPLDTYDFAHPEADRDVWEMAVRKVRTGMMPPSGEPRPARDVLDGMVAHLEARLDGAEELAPADPPRLHRLNRAEYANAVRDLLGVEIDVSALLPTDDALDGFDNMSAALGISPSFIEAYIAAAMKISRQAVGDRDMIPERASYVAPRGVSQNEHVDGLPLGTRGGLRVEHYFPLDAEYEFRIAAGVSGGLPTRQEPPEPDVLVTLDGAPIEVEDVSRFRMRVPAGKATVGVALLDAKRFHGVEFIYEPLRTFRNSSVQSVTIIGPYDATGAGDTPSRRKIFSCMPATPAEEEPCAREIASRLGMIAFRRPLGAQDPKLERLMAAYTEGRDAGDFEVGVQYLLARMLSDPEFLFRFETQPEDLLAGEAYAISDLELASRLAFFIWSSLPDAELITLASAGELGDADVLDAQVERMLADSRAHALVENFAGQWLHLRELDVVEPTTRDWNAALRDDLRRETEMLFESVLAEDRSVLELLDADYTFLNDRLAAFYGVDGVRGAHFRRVALADDDPRRGLLGQGSILTVTSVANRTSPVIRGAWILENLLGAPVPNPPPGVETDLERDQVGEAATLRGRLEIHRTDPACASCHAIMDPVGLSLENFDLIGRWRDTDGGDPIDATGVLVDGTPLAGPADLRAALLARSDAFVSITTEKLMAYAIGRTLTPEDMPAVREVVREAAEDDYAFSALVRGVASSAPFRMRMALADAAMAENVLAPARPSTD